MKKTLKTSLITSILIIFGVYRWGMLRTKMPKTLFLLFDSLCKLVISFFLAKNRRHFDIDVCYIATLFSLNKFLFYKCAEHLNIIVLAVLSPMKLIFVLLFSRMFYKKSFSLIQYFAIGCILMGNCIIQWSDQYKKSDIHFFYIFLSIFSNFLGAIAMILFDQKIRKKKRNFWDYLYTFSFLSSIISCFEMIFEVKLTKYDFLVHLREWRFILTIFVGVGETFLNTFLMFTLFPLEKGLISNLIIVSVTFLCNWFYKEILSKISVLACFITYFGIILFEHEKNKLEN